jgi:hypothetical protein
MRKTHLVFLTLGTIFCFLATDAWAAKTDADTAPVFDKQPSVVVDLWKNGGKGKYEDNIKFTNATLQKNVSFTVHGYEQKKGEWTLIGGAKLKYHCDTDTVSSPLSGKIDKFRWLAIYAAGDISFDAQVTPYRNDVLITILDKMPAGFAVGKPLSKNETPVFDVPSSIVLDLWANKGKGKYEDNIKLMSASSHQNISFNVYGYNQKINQWIVIGPKKFSDTNEPVTSPWGWLAGDPDAIDTPWSGDLDQFRWIAIQSLDGISFDAQPTMKSSDINIMIVDK